MNPDDLADFYGRDESKVPFEYLDPCCQKEILERRHYNEVGQSLRTVDRSQRRLDAAGTVFANLDKIGWSCGCCLSEKGYSSLDRLRRRLGGTQSEKAGSASNSDADGDRERESERRGEEEEDVDEDEDDLDDDFAIPLTAQEQERLNQIATAQQNRQLAESSPLRLAKHLDESVDHLLQLIDVLLDVSIVVHIYQDDDRSALIDYVLEAALAPRYFGTMFRRVSCSSAMSSSSESRLRSEVAECFSNALVNHHPCIMVFRGRQRVLLLNSNELDGLGDSHDLVSRHLHTLLSHAHALSDELPAVVLQPRLLAQAGSREERDDEDEREAFCDDPDCTKRFPHEHVGRKGPSFLLSKEQAVFAPGAMQRL